MFRPRVCGRDGFTLIELLVVVAIVSLLVSMLLPALDRARGEARQLLGLTNLRSQAQAAGFYADDNDDYVVRGRMCLRSLADLSGCGAQPVGNYATAILPYLNTHYAGWSAGRLRQLWRTGDRRRRSPLNRAYASVPQFRCPEDPLPEWNLHYLSNTMPIPYRLENVRFDTVGDRLHGDEDTYGQPSTDFGRLYYPWASRRSALAAYGPSERVFITEVNVHLMEPFGRNQPQHRLHTFYLGAHLPFSFWQRIANDRRHPGGINAVFFDGHAATFALRRLDAGWPKSLGIRLRWFSPLADDVPDDYR